MSLNYLMLFTFKDFESGADKTQGPLRVLWRTLKNLADVRLVTWLLIMSCFWLMMYQVWDLHPNFLTDWVDSSGIAGVLAHLPGGSFFGRETERGLMVPQEGAIECRVGGELLEIAERRRAVGYVAPEVDFYRELSTVENLDFYCRLRGCGAENGRRQRQRRSPPSAGVEPAQEAGEGAAQRQVQGQVDVDARVDHVLEKSAAEKIIGPKGRPVGRIQ